MALKETFYTTGENLIKKIKELIAEGNVTKITISDKNGAEIISFPVTIGVIGAIVAPIIAAVGAVAALLTECKITVERKDDDNSNNGSTSSEEQNHTNASDIQIMDK